MTRPGVCEPFQFYTRLGIRELTGLRAVTLDQLAKHLRQVPGAVIYHHTHHYLQQHQYLTPEPPNDFAHWVAETLGEKTLGERLASINTVEFSTLRGLRWQLVTTVEAYLQAHPMARLRFAPPEEAFHFIKVVSIVLPTPYRAATLPEFATCLEAVTVDSLYFHMFEARLRLERGVNDFADWFERALDERALARAVSTLDPYTHTMDELRQTILRLVSRRLAGREVA